MFERRRLPVSVDADGGGGSYLESVSDLMAGLIFVFILTLLVFAFTYRQATGEITDALDVRQDILHELERSLLDQGVLVQVDSEQGVLHLPESILFPLGSAELREEGKQALATLARELRRVLTCYSGPRTGQIPESCDQTRDLRGKLDAIFIEGHTDDLPINTPQFPDNWALSAARAVETYRAMVATAPQLDRMSNYAGQPLFGVSGYADRRPVAPNVDNRSRAQNRRIDLRFVMATPRLPDVVEEIAEAIRAEGGGR